MVLILNDYEVYLLVQVIDILHHFFSVWLCHLELVSECPLTLLCWDPKTVKVSYHLVSLFYFSQHFIFLLHNADHTWGSVLKFLVLQSEFLIVSEENVDFCLKTSLGLETRSLPLRSLNCILKDAETIVEPLDNNGQVVIQVLAWQFLDELLPITHFPIVQTLIKWLHYISNQIDLFIQGFLSLVLIVNDVSQFLEVFSQRCKCLGHLMLRVLGLILIEGQLVKRGYLVYHVGHELTNRFIYLSQLSLDILHLDH